LSTVSPLTKSKDFSLSTLASSFTVLISSLEIVSSVLSGTVGVGISVSTSSIISSPKFTGGFV